MLTRTAAFGLAFALVTVPAKASEQSEAMLGAFVAWVDSSPMWMATSGAPLSEGADTVIEKLTISLEEFPAFSARIGEIRLTDLTREKGGGFSASKLAIANFGAKLDIVAPASAAGGSMAQSYSIPSMKVTDLSMPSYAGFAFDMNAIIASVIELYAITVEGEFGEVVIPEASMSASDYVNNTESTVVYRNMRLAGLRDGVVQSQTIGPITGEVLTAAADPVSYAIERVEAGPFDLGAIIRIFDESQYTDGRGDGVWMSIGTNITYAGISASGPGFSMNLGDVTLENLEGRQMDEPYMRDLDLLLSGGMADANPQEMIQMALGFYSVWRVGEFSVSGLDVDAPAEGGAFKLGNFTISNLSAAGIERVALSGVDLRAPDVVASLGSFELTGYRFPSIMSLILGMGQPYDENATPEDREAHARMILDAVPRFDHIGIHDVSGGMGAEPQLSLETFTLDFSEWNEIFAGATDLLIEGLAISRDIPGLDAQTLQMMDSLGYDRLVFGASLTDRWSPEEGRDEAVWTLSLQDGADLEVGYTLSGLTTEWVLSAISAESETMQMKLLSRLMLDAASIKVNDRSLLQRGFDAAASLQGLTVDGPTYREQIRGAIPFMLSTAVPEAIASMVTRPIQAYLGGGQVLIAEISPPAPVSLFDIMNLGQTADPAATAEMLGLTLRTEPSAPPQ